MTGRIPNSFEFTEMLWFTLRCECGFESARESLGLVGENHSTTEHASYRVAWFDDRANELRSDDFRLPIDIRPNEIANWVTVHAVQPVTELNRNCLYLINPLPFETSIPCPDCETRQLVQFGELVSHRYIEYESGFTIVENPDRD